MLLRAISYGFRKAKSGKQVDFMTLIKPALGPLTKISAEEKKRVNSQIDKRMAELQATGLSREQILLSESKKGIPLAVDPFFQYLRRNYLARQIYIKPGQRFTVEKVIEIALRQDIGLDASYSLTRPIQQRVQRKLSLSDIGRVPDRDRTEFNPSTYNAETQNDPSGILDELRPVQSVKYVYKPLEKYERLKVKQRILKSYDIHWRNIDLITQFVSRAGNIRSRFATCLPYVQHKKVQRAIKTARSMLLIPQFGQIPVTMKRSLTSLEEDVNEIGRKQVNLETGHIYFTRNKSADFRKKQQALREDPDSRFEEMQKEGPHYKLWLDSLKKEMHDSDFERKSMAEKYARQLKKRDLEAKGEKLQELQDYSFMEMHQRMGIRRQKPQKIPAERQEEFKKAFKEEQERAKAANIYNFAEDLLREKTL